MNDVLPKNGVSDKLALKELLGSIVINFNKHCRPGFGSYVKTYEENYPRKIIQARALGVITLGPDCSLVIQRFAS